MAMPSKPIRLTKFFFDSDRVQFDGWFVDDERHGEGTEYYDDGKVKFKGLYVHGVPSEGSWYDRDGRITFHGAFRGGVPANGTQYTYYKGDNILSFVGLVDDNGERNGPGKQWDRKGRLTFEGTFDDGNEVSGTKSEFHGDTDQLRRTGAYRHGNFHGTVREYYDHGGHRFDGRYSHGHRARGQEWNARGLRVFSGTYDDCGKPCTGTKSEYFPDSGQLSSTGEYTHGEFHGAVREYHRNGEVKSDGLYVHGERDQGEEWNARGQRVFSGAYDYGDPWTGTKYEYFTSGATDQPKQIGEYKHGEFHGGVRKYYRNGKVKFEGAFENGVRAAGTLFFGDGLIKGTAPPRRITPWIKSMRTTGKFSPF